MKDVKDTRETEHGMFVSPAPNDVKKIRAISAVF